ncbi:MAG: RNA methyltransferase [Lachnospiraceae bacterium]|nr:RNA methyltransferase [Lachnospiraceae bacterium]
MDDAKRANIIQITDFCAPELDVYARLTEGQLLNRHEPEKGMFIAESPRVIERALDYGCVPVSILIETKQIEAQGKDIIARCVGIPVYTAAFDVLTQITGYKLTRGMLCAMYRPAQKSVEEVCAGARRIAVLENVVNPTNVGAIFRSAAALGMDGIVLTPACSNPLYRRAIRVSMGTVFQIPWAFLPEGYRISQLHALGFKTVAMALKEDSLRMDAPQMAQEQRLAIVLGTEGDGLAAETIEACDFTVRIPMAPGVDSLNVAAASAVAFWQFGTVRDRGV